MKWIGQVLFDKTREGNLFWKPCKEFKTYENGKPPLVSPLRYCTFNLARSKNSNCFAVIPSQFNYHKFFSKTFRCTKTSIQYRLKKISSRSEFVISTTQSPKDLTGDENKKKLIQSDDAESSIDTLFLLMLLREMTSVTTFGRNAQLVNIFKAWNFWLVMVYILLTVAAFPLLIESCSKYLESIYDIQWWK